MHKIDGIDKSLKHYREDLLGIMSPLIFPNKSSH